MFLIPCLPEARIKHIMNARKKSEECKQHLENEMNKPKFNNDHHTKLFAPDMNGEFEIYVAFNETSEEKKRQILKELNYFQEKLEKILRG